jgi:hypothetical protein
MPKESLEDFVMYCQIIPRTDNNVWLLSSLIATLPYDAYVYDVELCLKKYYRHLKEAVAIENYMYAAIINKALDAELEHYAELGKAVYKKNVKKELLSISNNLRKDYLGC